MLNTPLKKSIALHVVVFILCVIDLPLFFWNKPTTGQVPIIVDLKDVKISEMTNLPPKAKMGEENKEASQIKRKIEKKKYTKDETKAESKPDSEKTEPKKEKASETQAKAPKKDHLIPPQPKKPTPKVEKKKEEKPKTKPQPQPKKEEAKKVEYKKEDKKPELANPLKSLLASVDDLEKAEGSKNTLATIKEGTEVNNMGIEGGVGGSYFSELSISEIDAIAGRLRACWNLDPGAMGIEYMIVEIKAELNQNGTVRKVEILDTARYNSDNHFRSVADSAVRAVHICAPYSILVDKYAEKYDMWKTMQLRFNPLDNSVQ